MNIDANEVLDAKGLACPMPIVKTKKMMKDVAAGDVLEIQATDKGSTADLKAWAESTGHQYLGTVDEGDVLKHYLRKASADEANEEKIHPNVVELSDFQSKVEAEKLAIIDVREPAEYAFGHVPGAINIPLGDLDKKISELDTGKEWHIICRTGSRSDMAAQKLTSNGFNSVKNVVPGMIEWQGSVEKSES